MTLTGGVATSLKATGRVAGTADAGDLALVQGVTLKLTKQRTGRERGCLKRVPCVPSPRSMQLNKLMKPLNPALMNRDINKLDISPVRFPPGRMGVWQDIRICALSTGSRGLYMRVRLLLVTMVGGGRDGVLAHGTTPEAAASVQPGVDAGLMEEMAADVQET